MRWALLAFLVRAIFQPDWIQRRWKATSFDVDVDVTSAVASVQRLFFPSNWTRRHHRPSGQLSKQSHRYSPAELIIAWHHLWAFQWLDHYRTEFTDPCCTISIEKTATCQTYSTKEMHFCGNVSFWQFKLDQSWAPNGNERQEGLAGGKRVVREEEKS